MIRIAANPSLFEQVETHLVETMFEQAEAHLVETMFYD